MSAPDRRPVDADLLARAAAAESDARAAGRWSERRDAALAASFESAVTAALAEPALAERSLRLRRVARRLVPLRLRPLARRGAGALDDLVLHARRGRR